MSRGFSIWKIRLRLLAYCLEETHGILIVPSGVSHSRTSVPFRKHWKPREHCPFNGIVILLSRSSIFQMPSLRRVKKYLFAVLITLSLVIIFLCARQFFKKTPAILPNATKIQVPEVTIPPAEGKCIARHVDTTDWQIFAESGYEYTFRYPATWKAITPSHSYIDLQAVSITDPNDNRYDYGEGGGTMPYSIGVSRVTRQTQFPVPAARTLGELGEMFAGLPSTLFNSEELSNEGVRKVVLYDINGDVNRVDGIVIGEHAAYQVGLNSVFQGGHSQTDINTFCGILASFSLRGD